MPKAGRPKLPEDQVRTYFHVRLSKAERASVERAAEAAGENVSQWARNHLLKASGYDNRST